MMEGNWFYEKHHTFPGQAFGLKVEKVLFQKKSKYQDVLVFQSKEYGKVMVLDGVVNSTERDECAYQEMITFLPLNSHPNPKNVLIVGGGDGGVARECCKHPCVQHVTQVEIDEVVIEASRLHLPHMSCGMDEAKVTVRVEDGLAYLQNNPQHMYDVIIADLSDPDGPAEKLFEKTFYTEMKKHLTPDGILCAQGENIWLDAEMISTMVGFCKETFGTVNYAFNNVPTYTCGSIGYILCSLKQEKDFRKPLHVFTDEEKDSMKLNFYNEEVHTASFALPQFIKKVKPTLKEKKAVSKTNKQICNGPPELKKW